MTPEELAVIARICREQRAAGATRTSIAIEHVLALLDRIEALEAEARPSAIGAAAAVGIVNAHLHVDGRLTDRGDEVKCMVFDDEDGGRTKAYLDAKTCAELAEAFDVLRAALEVKP